MKYVKYILIAIILLVIIFIGRGLLTPSVSYDSEVVANKPVKESWAVMTDESNLPKWIKGFIKSELKSGTANTVGAISDVYVDDHGKEMVMKETITSVEPNDHLAMSFEMDFMKMDYMMVFEEKNGQTRITTRSKTEGNNMLAKSLISFMQGGMKKQEAENLNRLKKLIENNIKNYFPEPVVVDTLAPIIEKGVEVL